MQDAPEEAGSDEEMRELAKLELSEQEGRWNH